jgi:hypothetical protein
MLRILHFEYAFKLKLFERLIFFVGLTGKHKAEKPEQI